jgi:ribosomal subunit interface protein
MMVMIPVNIKTTGAVMLTDELRSFVEEKLEHVAKLLNPEDTTARVDVELASIPGGRSASFRAEFNLFFDGGFARAEAKRETLHTSVDAAIEELRREVKRTLTKRRDLVRRGAAKIKDMFRGFQNPFG